MILSSWPLSITSSVIGDLNLSLVGGEDICKPVGVNDNVSDWVELIASIET